jgi:branched-chain amino acid transport system permease protein
MLAQFLQFLFSGITMGLIYALAALGFSIIYNSSGVINFAQGEFIMLGGMATVALASMGLPLPAAIALAVCIAVLAGLLVQKFAIERARNASVVSMIIITIGASLVIRGLIQVFLGKESHALKSFSGDAPLSLLGATILPQSLWVVALSAAVVAGLTWFFGKTLTGKAMLATSHNRLAANLIGINTRNILLLAFGLAAALGSFAGIIVAPITYTSSDIGVMFGLKGFVAAVLGGLGSSAGAVLGGLLLGIAEAMTAGYISSAYKDAMPFVLILFVLFFLPRGLLGSNVTERV